MAQGWMVQRSQEEQRAQPSAGDMSGNICPGVVGTPNPPSIEDG